MKNKQQLWTQFEQANKVSVPKECWDAGWIAKGEYLRAIIDEAHKEYVDTNELLQAYVNKAEDQRRTLANLHKANERMKAELAQVRRVAGSGAVRIQLYEKAMRDAMAGEITVFDFENVFNQDTPING